MEEADKDGYYPRLTVERPWSAHNPMLEGEFSAPQAIRWYLERELNRLADAGARISVGRGRRALSLQDPAIGPAVDETRWDLRRKKLFLFGPERMALSIDRLQHYTGTPAEEFQRYVLLTNYSWHVSEFRAALPGCIGPDSDGRQMPAWHHALPGRAGLTMINIGVGPSNAKTITDHLAVLRPDLVLMIGHCGGLRNHQEIGDLVLATAYLRDDRVLDDVLPLSVPVVSNHTLNTLLLDELTARSLRNRMGIVFTTANRNWEFQFGSVADRLRRLEDSGTLSFHAEVNPRALGYTMCAIVRISPAGGGLRLIPGIAREVPNVTECYRITGEDCYFMKVWLHSIEDLEPILDLFTPHGRTTTSIVHSAPVPPRPLPIPGPGWTAR